MNKFSLEILKEVYEEYLNNKPSEEELQNNFNIDGLIKVDCSILDVWNFNYKKEAELILKKELNNLIITKNSFLCQEK